MTVSVLSFNDVHFDVVDVNNNPWLRQSDIARALYGVTKGGGQSDATFENAEKALKRLFLRNQEEFTDKMTALVELDTKGGKQQVRVFSLRGCYLLAMFARTAIAKQFRIWVLDVLELQAYSAPYHPSLEALPPSYATKSQREPLIKAVRSFVKLSAEHGKPLSYSQAHTLINLKMGVEDVEHLTAEQLPLALKVVGELMADVIMRSDNCLAAPAQPLSITLTFPPLENQTSRRYLVIQSSDQQISSSLLNDDALIASRAEIINQLTQEGYVIFEKSSVGAAKLVREFVPAQLLPVLIETAQARWNAIAAAR